MQNKQGDDGGLAEGRYSGVSRVASDDEQLDRLVAGAYFFRELSYEQWGQYVMARAEYFEAASRDRATAAERFFAQVPFVREIVERDKAATEDA